MILSYKRDMTHNYMVPESEDTISGQDYQIHMLMENHMEGLLPCSIKKINGKSRYFYDITSRQSMSSVYEKEYLREKELRILLKGLYIALMEVKRFLLDADKVVLEPEMIYMDIETKEPVFTYLPSFQGDILSSFQEFAAKLLQLLDQNDKDAVLLGYEIYRKSMAVNYSLEKLLKETAYGMPEPEPVKPIVKKSVDTFVEPPPVKSEERFSEVPSKKELPHVERRIIVMGSAAVLAAAGLGFAAWFWKLSVTQLGGIAFLMASLLAYGISADSKRKKETSEQLLKKEKKADHRSVRKMEANLRQQSVHKQEVLQKLEPMQAEVRAAAQEKVGATVLLSAGEEYVPHLSLISMNPRERNSVVLLNDSYTVGKLKNKVDIHIDHPSISRIHARIRKEGKEYFLYDLNSTNGTFVNGQRLAVNEKVQIQLSDEIRFADLGYYVGKC